MASTFAIITIELPLEGGTQEDAKALANLIQDRALTTKVDRNSARPFGHVIDVHLEQRTSGAMGRTRAQALVRNLNGANKEETQNAG